MRRRIATFCVALLAALVAAAPASAILHGVPDGNDHPYVGLVVFYDAKDQRLHRCSGTLLSPTILLTAGHCTDGTARARVWFGAEPEVDGYPDPASADAEGTPVTHPEFSQTGFPNRRDVGVVVLDDPVGLPTYAELAPLGALDGLDVRRGPDYPTFTVVGYGFLDVQPEVDPGEVRYRGTTKLVNLQNADTDGFNVQMSSNPGHWSGGICRGDSGGPVLLDDTHVVVAVSSFVGNSNCKGGSFGYRTDIADAQDFIDGFLP
jgi:hypothetical protein